MSVTHGAAWWRGTKRRMGGRFDARGRIAKGIVLLLMLGASTLHAPVPGSAQSPRVGSADFRERVVAVAQLGKVPGARVALEHVLAQDPHPTVRRAAATALGARGDAAAVPALQARLAQEPEATVRTQIQAALDALKRGGDHPLDRASFVVRLGTMSNLSRVRGDDLAKVLEQAAHARARALSGVVMTDGRDAALLRQATERRVPYIVFDGALLEVKETAARGSVEIAAQVEFTLRRDNTLRGKLVGRAKAITSAHGLNERERARLQDDAVGGAVDSAMSGAPQGMTLSAR